MNYGSVFQLRGRKVEILRYQVTDPEGKKHFFVSEAAASRVAEECDGTVSPVDNSAFDWMDGLVIPESPNRYLQAVKIADMGQEGYEKMISRPSTEELAQQNEANIDYLSMMTGIDLPGEEGTWIGAQSIPE